MLSVITLLHLEVSFIAAVDITKMISDQGGGGIPWSVYGTLLGTSTIIQCYPLVRAFLYPPPDDARGCQRAPARCPRLHACHYCHLLSMIILIYYTGMLFV